MNALIYIRVRHHIIKTHRTHQTWLSLYENVFLCSCHSIQDSLLSSNSSFTGYRGILNWIIILLVTYLFPLHNRHGFLIDVKKVLGHLIEDNCNWPSVILILGENHWGGDDVTASHWYCRFVGLQDFHVYVSHCLKSTFMLCPPGGAFFSLLFFTILGMKLYSYQETNRWYRLAHLGICRKIRMDLIFNSVFIFSELYYFLLAPTLCFQRGFPCCPNVRINKLLHRLIEMVVVVQIMVGIVQQVQQIAEVLSLLYSSLVSLHLCAPTHFLWLLFFFLTHSYLNFCAELLRFGDRHFYGDWWNATTLIAFWKNWNIPFQRWCHRYYQHFLVCVLECLTWVVFFAYMFFFLCIKRHIYTRLVERNVSPSHAEFCRLWIFLMMLLVAVFLRNYFQGNYGNGLVWLFLLLGPPLAVATYFHDHYVSLLEGGEWELG
uniref:diacylglycerol O-acyltransferase n=1 Tax=Astatotilapia calliptera TaxID=8154 RepID=A0A3P8NRE4_ASTCA